MPAPIGNRPVSAPTTPRGATGPASAPTPSIYGSFVPKGPQPSTWTKKAIEFSGTVDGREVKVSLMPPGTSFWKGNRSAFVDGYSSTYREAHELAAALRTAGWGATADLIAKQPGPGKLFVDFSEGKMTRERSVGGTLQNEPFAFAGKLSPTSDATVRYEPTADGEGRVFMAVTGDLAAPERELTKAERYQLAERLIHGGMLRQAADFISPKAVHDWRSSVPGGPGLDTAGPVKPTFDNMVVKPAISWLQELVNRLTR